MKQATNAIPLHFFPSLALNSNIAASLAKAYLLIDHLKQLWRQGWLRGGRDISLEKCESVADHCFGVLSLAILVMPYIKTSLDWVKVILMAVIHEYGEVLAGDIVPHEGVSPDKKHYDEEISIRAVFAELPDCQIYVEIWQEYEAQTSEEAKFVKQLDKLEMALQSCIYNRQYGMPNEDFIEDVLENLSEPLLREMLLAVLE